MCSRIVKQVELPFGCVKYLLDFCIRMRCWGQLFGGGGGYFTHVLCHIGTILVKLSGLSSNFELFALRMTLSGKMEFNQLHILPNRDPYCSNNI